MRAVAARRFSTWGGHGGDKSRETKKHVPPARSEALGPQTVAQLTLVPLGTQKVSLAGAVNTTARVCHNAQEQGNLDAVELGSTATVIEGRLRDVLEAVAKVTEAQLHHDPRVMMTIQLDVYPGQQNRIAKKHSVIQQVKQHIKNMD